MRSPLARSPCLDLLASQKCVHDVLPRHAPHVHELPAVAQADEKRARSIEPFPSHNRVRGYGGSRAALGEPPARRYERGGEHAWARVFAALATTGCASPASRRRLSHQTGDQGSTAAREVSRGLQLYRADPPFGSRTRRKCVRFAIGSASSSRIRRRSMGSLANFNPASSSARLFGPVFLLLIECCLKYRHHSHVLCSAGGLLALDDVL